MTSDQIHITLGLACAAALVLSLISFLNSSFAHDDAGSAFDMSEKANRLAADADKNVLAALRNVTKLEKQLESQDHAAHTRAMEVLDLKAALEEHAETIADLKAMLGLFDRLQATVDGRKTTLEISLSAKEE